MSVAFVPGTYYDEIIDFLASGPSAEQIVNFRPSDPVQQRAQELLARNRAGQLTAEEELALDQFVEAEWFLQAVVARIHARQRHRP